MTSPTANITQGAALSAPAAKPGRPRESMRDTLENVLFALALACLFRTFEAEAFVIPTGSMAPTLYGRHKETTCVHCGYDIVVGASQEVDGENGVWLNPDNRIFTVMCSNCGGDNPQIKNELAFNGDRILVNKFPYEFGEPNRWDVFVFKYPTDPYRNYIKRLVGLPGDNIRIRHGDLYQVSEQGEEILRKSPDKQRALQIPVYDDDRPPRDLLEAGWPERWAPMQRGDSATFGNWKNASTGWQADPQKRTYSIEAPSPASGGDPSQTIWLRYRHYFPDDRDWATATRGGTLDPAPRLIGDLCSYNLTLPDMRGYDLGPFWNPDLTINFDLQIRSLADNAAVTIELCEGTHWYRCRWHPATGKVQLEDINSQLNERSTELAVAQTRHVGTGAYSLSFAHVDDRLCLWINDSLVPFDSGALVHSAGATGNPFPTNVDLTPVGIAAEGMSATVSHLRLERDIYYRSARPGDDFRNESVQLMSAIHDPDEWGTRYARIADMLSARVISVPDGHYLAFGDNSPESNDSRLWDASMTTVPHHLLVGRAFYIYWPHGVPFMNDGRGYTLTWHKTAPRQPVKDYPRMTLPFYPQFWRMKRIR